MPSVLDRTVNFLADRLDRRGFLGKAAVVGSAVVAAPLDFGLKPTSAYAAICQCNGSSCPCGSLCCDGYTEFCCTLNGANACPPGTLTAGWWKVDGSQFCGGAARYYLDCNAQCGSCDCGANGVCSGACSGTGCGCAQGNCNNRKAGCTRFRYGQCNQGVRCVGPIVCRVVTCAPPWTFDSACGTTARTDEATRNHDRPCLDEPYGALEAVVDAGGSIRVSGWAVANSDYQRAGIRVFIDDTVVYHGLAELERPDVRWAYPAFGLNTGYDVRLQANPGRHVVCVWGVDRRNGRTSLIGFREVDVARPRGRIEYATDLGGGRVRLSGYAVDPSWENRHALVRVRVDNREVYRARTDVARPDIVRYVPGAYAESGFSLDLDVDAGSRSFCVDVINRYGVVLNLGCVTREVARDPVGAVDSVTDLGGGRVRVVGWVLDPRRVTAPVPIRVRVDGQPRLNALAQLPRPDIGAIYTRYGPNHGFDVVVPAAAGGRVVCVDVEHLGQTYTQLVCNNVTVTG